MTNMNKRRIEKRTSIMEILTMAKANGCEVYITPLESNYDYGYIIFNKELTGDPIDIIMYIQPGDFWGFDLCVEYIPSRETGSGCRCNEESISTIDWDTLLKQKQNGFEFANKLHAHMFVNADQWKQRQWNFKELIRL